MSTELKTIKGRYETGFEGLDLEYDVSELRVIGFSGGKEEAMIQLDIDNGFVSVYTQLNREQVRSLIDILEHHLSYTNQ